MYNWEGPFIGLGHCIGTYVSEMMEPHSKVLIKKSHAHSQPESESHDPVDFRAQKISLTVFSLSFSRFLSFLNYQNKRCLELEAAGESNAS